MRLPRRLAGPLVPALVAGLLLGLSPAGAAVGDPPPARQPVGRFGPTVLTEAFRSNAIRYAQQAVSGDGRTIAFVTATDTAIDGNGRPDVYVRDRATGATDLVTRDTVDKASQLGGYEPSISADGRYVAFLSTSPDLVAGDSGTDADVFLRDLRTGTTRRVNRNAGGARVGVEPYSVQVSADGRSVLWRSNEGTFARIAGAATITTIATDIVTEGWLSGDGRYVAWRGFDGVIHRRDLTTGDDVLITATPTGEERRGYDVSLSYDGSRAAFYSSDRDITSPESAVEGVYVRDVDTGVTSQVAAAPVVAPTISGDGSTVTFSTWLPLVPEDTDPAVEGLDESELDVYAARIDGSGRRLISEDLTPSPRGGTSGIPGPFWYGEVSADGQVVSFPSAVVLPDSGTTTPTVQRWAVGARPDQDAGLPSLVTGDLTPLYGRAPTAAERNAAVADVRALRRTRPQVILDALHDPAVAGPRAGVVRLYEAYFLRPPDTSGYDYWVGQRRAGRSIQAVSQLFSGTPEFRTLYGSLTNRQFVRLIYENVLGRTPDRAGEDYWTAQLDARARSRGEVMTGFSEAPENKVRTQNRVDLTIARRAYLGTTPSRAQLDTWAARWRVGVPVTSTLLTLRP